MKGCEVGCRVVPWLERTDHHPKTINFSHEDLHQAQIQDGTWQLSPSPGIHKQWNWSVPNLILTSTGHQLFIISTQCFPQLSKCFATSAELVPFHELSWVREETWSAFSLSTPPRGLIRKGGQANKSHGCLWGSWAQNPTRLLLTAIG